MAVVALCLHARPWGVERCVPPLDGAHMRLGSWPCLGTHRRSALPHSLFQIMPAKNDFVRAGRYDIARAVERWGGLYEVSTWAVAAVLDFCMLCDSCPIGCAHELTMTCSEADSIRPLCALLSLPFSWPRSWGMRRATPASPASASGRSTSARWRPQQGSAAGRCAGLDCSVCGCLECLVCNCSRCAWQRLA